MFLSSRKSGMYGIWAVIAIMSIMAVQSHADETISGTVKDQSTGKALSGVLVNIKGTGMQSVSGADGSFSVTYVAQQIPQIIEAEDMTLSGAYMIDQARMNGQGITIDAGQPQPATGSAAASFGGTSGTYTITISAVPENDGQPTLKLFIGTRLVHTETYRTDPVFTNPDVDRYDIVIAGIAVNQGDMIKLEGTSHDAAYARVDKISLTMTGTVGVSDYQNTRLSDREKTNIMENHLQLYNLAGVRVNRNQQPLTSFPLGIYLMSVQTPNGIQVVKIAGFGKGTNVISSVPKTAATQVTLAFNKTGYRDKEVPAVTGTSGLVVELVPVSSGEWPDETNTGVLPGSNLTPYAGGDPVNGAVIENKDINGILKFAADNVTIRNCKIHSSTGYWGIYLESGTNLLVENCEIYSTSSQGELDGIKGGNMTVRRCNIYNWENGVDVGSNSVVEDCYIHDPSTRAGGHFDGIQWAGGSNVVIRHNHIDINSATGCVNVGGQNSTDGLREIDIYHNLLNGGSYSIYLEGRVDHTPGGIHGVRVIGNVWEKGSYTYGTHAIMGDVTDVTWQDNYLDDGTPVMR